MVTGYVAFHAFGAAMHRAVSGYVDLGGANFFAFAVVGYAAGSAVTQVAIFAVIRAAIHDAFLLVYAEFNKRVYGCYAIQKGTNRAEFVTPEPAFFEADKNGNYGKNQEFDKKGVYDLGCGVGYF
jgi:hypothetical protein